MENTQFLEITSPMDDSVIGKVPALSKEEVDQRMLRAKAAFPDWRDKPMFERIEMMHRTSDLLEQNKTELAELLTREIGKDRKSAEAEVVRTADFIRFTADTAKSLHGESVHGDSFRGYNKGKFAIIHREPLGLVLAISPFNYPVNLAASKIAPALVMGNTVIFKPASIGCLSGLYLVNMFHKAGIPEEVLVPVTGKGSEIGDYAVTHPAVDFINFTGSTEVGKKISQQVAMVPQLMELGGKDAAIVLEDADLDAAAKNIVGGAFSYSGQRCTAVKRVLVVENVHHKLVEQIRKYMKRLVVGNPLEVNADVVPLISQKSADFVWNLIQSAVKQGAILLEGGTREGNLIAPTLLDQVTANMELAWVEPFGPVLPILTVESVEEAVSIANQSEYGLQASLFTKDINQAFSIAEKLEVGTVQINGKTERGPDHLPFLGVKSSGIGVQGIRYSMEAMTRLKSTVVNLTIY